MLNIKSAAAAAIITLASGQALAADHRIWTLNQHGIPFALSSDQKGFAIMTKDYGISIMTVSGDCESDEFPGYQSKMMVNKQLVSFNHWCFEGDNYSAPETQAGLKFTENEFAKKSTVNIGVMQFSTKGFNAAIEEQKQRDLKPAL